MQRFRVFTLEEANRVVGTVADLTRHTRGRLDELRDAFRDGAESDVEAEIRTTLDSWAKAVLEIGGQPKGIFTVDFRSPDPNVLWCWAPDEETVCHRHFTWESFKDRVALDDEDTFWPALN